MNGLRKKKRGPCATAFHNVELARACHFWSKTQLVSRRKQRRECVACGSAVTNRNLGGNGGRSALTGPVWCLRCADYPRQLVLNFGSIG